MRLGLQGQLRRVWASRGVKVVQKLQFVFEWAYLLLAVDPLRGSLLWDWIPKYATRVIFARFVNLGGRLHHLGWCSQPPRERSGQAALLSGFSSHLIRPR